MLVYECQIENSDDIYKPWLSHGGFECFTPNMPLSWYACSKPLVVWAVGSEGIYMIML